MENTPDIALSPSEKRTLQRLTEGELHASELDWVALQRLKRHGLAEDQASGVVITQEGRRMLRRLTLPVWPLRTRGFRSVPPAALPLLTRLNGCVQAGESRL